MNWFLYNKDLLYETVRRAAASEAYLRHCKTPMVKTYEIVYD